MTTQEVVQELYDYLKFRFNKEGRETDLDLQFFARHFKDGVRGFFGVIVGEEQGTAGRQTEPRNIQTLSNL